MSSINIDQVSEGQFYIIRSSLAYIVSKSCDEVVYYSFNRNMEFTIPERMFNIVSCRIITESELDLNIIGALTDFMYTHSPKIEGKLLSWSLHYCNFTEKEYGMIYNKYTEESIIVNEENINEFKTIFNSL